MLINSQLLIIFNLSIQQKLLIGDDSGQISCYEFKRGEPQIVFQAKPFEGAITCLELGGNPAKRDKVRIL